MFVCPLPTSHLHDPLALQDVKLDLITEMLALRSFELDRGDAAHAASQVPLASTPEESDNADRAAALGHHMS